MQTNLMMRSEDYFSREMLQRVLRAVKGGILVGGQAVAFWCDYYGITLTDEDDNEADIVVPLTRDVDFLGDSDMAEDLANAVGGDLYLPSLDDQTPNTARVILYTDENHYLGVDFLGTLAGMDEKSVAGRAVHVTIEGESPLLVMHPVDCLESRIKNIYLLPNKQRPENIRQAKFAIEVSRHCISNAVNADGLKSALKLIERVYAIAISEAGIQIFVKWQINLMESIPHQQIPSEEFKNIRWPQMLTRLEKKRERYIERYKKAELKKA